MTLRIGVIGTGSSSRLGVSICGGGETSDGWGSGTNSTFIDSTEREASSFRVLPPGSVPAMP